MEGTISILRSISAYAYLLLLVMATTTTTRTVLSFSSTLRRHQILKPALVVGHRTVSIQSSYLVVDRTRVSTFIHKMGSSSSEPRAFDYVIVGTGPSAIGVLYGLLESFATEKTKCDTVVTPPFSVAILERGYGPPHDVTTQSPHRWHEAAHNTNSDSACHYRSNITGRILDLPVGQGLGGSSNINACICTPPLEQDLESWPEPWRSNLLPSAMSLQQRLQENHALTYGAHQPSFGSDIINQGKRISSPFHDDAPGLELSSPVATLASLDNDALMNQQRGLLVRKNYYTGLLEPLLMESPHLEEQLHWFRGCTVERLLLDKDKRQVTGVEYSSGLSHATWHLFANKRTILCAGAIESPALLLVSHLSGNYEPELSGVGKYLQDQAILPRAFWTWPVGGGPIPIRSTNGIAALGHFNIQGTEEMEQQRYHFQVAVTDSVSNASILPTVFAMAFRWECSWAVWTRIIDITFELLKLLLRLVIMYTPLGIILNHFTVSSLLCLMHPYSFGSVTIIPKTNTAKNFDKNRIELLRRRDVTVIANPGYLNDPRDYRIFKEAWDAMGCLIRYPSLELFPSFIYSILKPVVINYDWFECFARSFLLPYYHFSGTCAMQLTTENTEWVVHPTSLKLRGYDGLSVCDASVFPSMLSNPPALTCAALGYVFGQRLLMEDENTSASSSSDGNDQKEDTTSSSTPSVPASALSTSIGQNQHHEPDVLSSITMTNEGKEDTTTTKQGRNESRRLLEGGNNNSNNNNSSSNNISNINNHMKKYRKFHSVTVCMVPPPENVHVWDVVSNMRRTLHDPGFYRWPPHVNLLYPFLKWSNDDDDDHVEEDSCKKDHGIHEVNANVNYEGDGDDDNNKRNCDDRDNDDFTKQYDLITIVEKLDTALQDIDPFLVRLNRYGTFGGKHRGVLWLHPESEPSAPRGDETVMEGCSQGNGSSDPFSAALMSSSLTSSGGHDNNNESGPNWAIVESSDQPAVATTTATIAPLIKLQQSLERAFPMCRDQSQKGDGGKFVPHMTLSHFTCVDDAIAAQQQQLHNFSLTGLEFWLDRIYLLERMGDGGQFVRVAEIALKGGRDGGGGGYTLSGSSSTSFPTARTRIFDPPEPFPGMPTVEYDWVHEERMKLKQRRNGNNRSGGGSNRRRGRQQRRSGPAIPDTPEIIEAKRAERKAKRERLELEQQQQQLMTDQDQRQAGGETGNDYVE